MYHGASKSVELTRRYDTDHYYLININMRVPRLIGRCTVGMANASTGHAGAGPRGVVLKLDGQWPVTLRKLVMTAIGKQHAVPNTYSYIYI